MYETLYAKFANLTLSELFTKMGYKVPLYIFEKQTTTTKIYVTKCTLLN